MATEDTGNIVRQDLGTNLATSFLTYAQCVIADRALPDICDGLKPVQRRILYAMDNLGLASNKPFKKCARTVGEVLGKYHPHGDASVYDAMVRMAQDFSLRYPLVQGHGNFGSLDGDPPAAMRYTESRLTPVGELMMVDLVKNTVPMIPNFDDSESEPAVLATFFPSLLANGSAGIAVGMGCSIPPHNAKALYDTMQKMLDAILIGEELTDDEIIGSVLAPDFPTGGVIVDMAKVIEGYKTGRGSVKLRCKYEVETIKNNNAIVVTEIPYKVNKSRLMEQLDNLYRTTMAEELKSVCDESDKDGLRIVIELKKDVNVQWVIKKLLKHSDLQSSYGMNLIALYHGSPIRFTLKSALDVFLSHVSTVLRNRTQYDKDKAEHRLHIVEGILVCLDQLDAVIAIIRSIKDNKLLTSTLMSSFSLSEEQAKTIVEMKLRSLTKASKDEYLSEADSLRNAIALYTSILTDEVILVQTMKQELAAIAEKFTDERRTTISVEEDNSADLREMIKEENLVVTMTQNGVIKSVSDSEYSVQNRRVKGIKGNNLRDDDVVKFMLSVNSKDDLLFITNKGRCHTLPVYKLPVTNRKAAGKYINNFLSLEEDEVVISLLSRNVKTKGDLFFVTRKGVGKRLPLEQLSTIRNVTKVLSFREDDELVGCQLMKPHCQLLLVTAQGHGLRFDPNAKKNGVRPMGRSAAGVNAIKLMKDDVVVGLVVIDTMLNKLTGNNSDDIGQCLLASENGFAKRLNLKDITLKGRGGYGVIVFGISEKTGIVTGALSANENENLLIASRNGKVVRISIADIVVYGRAAAGVRTINLDDGDLVVSISSISDAEDEEEATA